VRSGEKGMKKGEIPGLWSIVQGPESCVPVDHNSESMRAAGDSGPGFSDAGAGTRDAGPSTGDLGLLASPIGELAEHASESRRAAEAGQQGLDRNGPPGK
jgi:hypothetical protein